MRYVSKIILGLVVSFLIVEQVEAFKLIGLRVAEPEKYVALNEHCYDELGCWRFFWGYGNAGQAVDICEETALGRLVRLKVISGSAENYYLSADGLLVKDVCDATCWIKQGTVYSASYRPLGLGVFTVRLQVVS